LRRKAKQNFPRTKSHLQEHFDLNSISDVEFMGSEIELRAKNGSILGYVDTLYRIRSHSLFVFMERETSIRGRQRDGQLGRTGVPRHAEFVLYIHSYLSII
jgi:hypothetical protein